MEYSTLQGDDDTTCKLCNNTQGIYSCPRCNIKYCSLKCYQSEAHVQCSEPFYQSWICQQLQLSGDEDEEQVKMKMEEILKRVHEQDAVTEEVGNELDSDDDEECADLESRLAGIDLNDSEQVWAKLNSDERQEFEAFLRSDNVSKIIPKWEPWWLWCDKKVQEVTEADKYQETCPKLKPCIPLFSKLCKNPSQSLEYNLINMVCAYVFTTRYFNGDHFDFPDEATSCIATLSLALNGKQNFGDFVTAVSSVQCQCMESDWITVDKENLDTMESDLEHVLKGPKEDDKKYYVLAVLSDLHELLNAALKKESKGKVAKALPGSSFPGLQLQTKKEIMLSMKKVEFYLSYSMHCLDLKY